MSPHQDAAELSHWVRQRALLGRYDRTLVDELLPFLGRRVLEVGCGAGTMSRYLADRELLVAVDSVAENVEFTRERLAGHANTTVIRHDITAPGESLSEFRIDSALCSNVLEHVADDQLALRRLAELLPPGGRLVAIVPAGPSLFGTLDRSLGHRRRYTVAELTAKLVRAGFAVQEIWWLNAPGVLGWFVLGKVLKTARIPDWQLRLFDGFSRSVRAVESRLRIRFGLSLVVVGERRGD